MSSNVFPVLPGLDTEVSKEARHKVTISEAVSGREDRTLWAVAPRFDFVLKYNFLRTYVTAPAPWAAYSEVAIVQKFIADHYSSFDSFLIADPTIVLAEDSTHDPAQKRVRFKENGVRIYQLVPTIWRAELALISVIE